MTAVRSRLEQLEESGLDPRSGELLVMLCWLVQEDVAIPEAELNAARRRAMFVLAAGGDPHRQLGVDDRAVKALALDLFTEQGQEVLVAGLDRLVLAARDLPEVSNALLFLAGDVDLAWRLFALGLLAEELDPDE